MEKRIWNQLKKAVMITAAVGILGAGAVSAAEFEAAELYVPAVGLKQRHSGSMKRNFRQN